MLTCKLHAKRPQVTIRQLLNQVCTVQVLAPIERKNILVLL